MLDQLVEEQAHPLPGAQLVTEQLSQLLFIQILRAHLEASGPMPAGWLRALADPRLAPALRLMHGDPARSWHLEELASACAMSRTTFAVRFKDIAGVAPLSYLADWRMRLAERALREEDTPVAVLARSLGYASESAFSNAFKRVTGEVADDVAERRGGQHALNQPRRLFITTLVIKAWAASKSPSDNCRLPITTANWGPRSA